MESDTFLCGRIRGFMRKFVNLNRIIVFSLAALIVFSEFLYTLIFFVKFKVEETWAQVMFLFSFIVEWLLVVFFIILVLRTKRIYVSQSGIEIRYFRHNRIIKWENMKQISTFNRQNKNIEVIITLETDEKMKFYLLERQNILFKEAISIYNNNQEVNFNLI